MTTRSRNVTFTAEGGGWLVLRRPEPGLRGSAPAELLAGGGDLPGNFRYVRDPHGGVTLLGEVCTLAGGATLEDARECLLRLLETPPAGDAPADEVLEAALEGAGLTWARRDRGWAVPANDRLPRELQIHASAGGIRVGAVLVEWDEMGPAEREALALFLLTAQAGLRGARCELDDRTARVAAVVETAHADADLAHALHAVAVACRQLARPSAALLDADVAGAYLRFHQPLAA